MVTRSIDAWKLSRVFVAPPPPPPVDPHLFNTKENTAIPYDTIDGENRLYNSTYRTLSSKRNNAVLMLGHLFEITAACEPSTETRTFSLFDMTWRRYLHRNKYQH
jgi:hypothetical protein